MKRLITLMIGVVAVLACTASAALAGTVTPTGAVSAASNDTTFTSGSNVVECSNNTADFTVPAAPGNTLPAHVPLSLLFDNCVTHTSFGDFSTVVLPNPYNDNYLDVDADHNVQIEVGGGITIEVSSFLGTCDIDVAATTIDGAITGTLADVTGLSVTSQVLPVTNSGGLACTGVGTTGTFNTVLPYLLDHLLTLT